MPLKGFTNGYPPQSGLYAFHDYEGNVYPTILLVIYRAGRWFVEKTDGTSNDIVEWYDRKCITAYHLVTRP